MSVRKRSKALFGTVQMTVPHLALGEPVPQVEHIPQIKFKISA